MTKLTQDWLQDAIDIHLHSRPSIFPRRYTDFELAQEAKAAGMRGIVLKAHEGFTAERAALVREVVSSIEVFGGVVLNHFVGGLNPHAVELSFAVGGRFVWMPSIHAANHIRYYGKAGFKEQQSNVKELEITPITVLNADGKLKLEVISILEVIRQNANAVLSNGHLNMPETEALFNEAKHHNIKNLVVTHPELPLSNFSLEFQQKMVSLGAVIERNFLPTTQAWGSFPIEKTVQDIRALGVENCVLATDLGQASGRTPTEGLTEFCELLHQSGFSEADVRMMVVSNPARLLSL
jgi:hypothetical protein